MATEINDDNLDAAEEVWAAISEGVPEEFREFPYDPRACEDLMLSDLQKCALIRAAKIRWCREKGLTIDVLVRMGRNIPATEDRKVYVRKAYERRASVRSVADILCARPDFEHLLQGIKTNEERSRAFGFDARTGKLGETA